MALKRILAVNFTVFIFLISSAQRHIHASKGLGLDNGMSGQSGVDGKPLLSDRAVSEVLHRALVENGNDNDTVIGFGQFLDHDVDVVPLTTGLGLDIGMSGENGVDRKPLPSDRTVDTVLHHALVENENDTDTVIGFGQFLDHDVDVVPLATGLGLDNGMSGENGVDRKPLPSDRAVNKVLHRVLVENENDTDTVIGFGQFLDYDVVPLATGLGLDSGMSGENGVDRKPLPGDRAVDTVLHHALVENENDTDIVNGPGQFLDHDLTLTLFRTDAALYAVEGKPSINDINVIDLETRNKRQANTSTAAPAATNQTPVATNRAPAASTTNAPPKVTTPFNWEEANLIHTDYKYYETLITKPIDINTFWTDLEGVIGHKTLSNSHRTAVTASLPFKFPFYGHLIDNVTIATGGFLYMSPFIHKFLTASQYIAPLMANFDTKTGGKNSTVLYKDVGTKFVVEWRDVHLQDQNATGTFRFQAILHNNGSIFFVYKQLPIHVSSISKDNHKVHVGLSDAFHVVEADGSGTKRRTIYEYHRVTLNTTNIEEGTIIIINPQPTCNLYSDCETCVSSKIAFNCKWCGIIKRCSDSIDWHRQEWLDKGCVHLAVNDIGLCLNTTTETTRATSPPPTTTETTRATSPLPPIVILCKNKMSDSNKSRCSKTTVPSTTKQNTIVTPCIIRVITSSNASGSGNCSLIPTAAPQKDQKPSNDNGAQIGIIVVVCVIIVVLIGSLGGWFYYAYSHPTSASGMWLMEHRPSQMKAKMSNMKFWKRNGTSGDKYAVESTA